MGGGHRLEEPLLFSFRFSSSSFVLCSLCLCVFNFHLTFSPVEAVGHLAIPGGVTLQAPRSLDNQRWTCSTASKFFCTTQLIHLSMHRSEVSTNHHHSSSGRGHFFPDFARHYCHIPLWLGTFQADESETCTLLVLNQRGKLGVLDPLLFRQISTYPTPPENVGYLLVHIVNPLGDIDFLIQPDRHRRALTVNESSGTLILTPENFNTGLGIILVADLLQSNHSRSRNNTQHLILKSLNRQNLQIVQSLFRTNSGSHGAKMNRIQGQCFGPCTRVFGPVRCNFICQIDKGFAKGICARQTPDSILRCCCLY